MTGWLTKRNLVKSSIVDEKGTKLYRLTIRGEILALALTNLLSSIEQAETLKFRKLDEKNVNVRKLLLGEK